jgi:hypothetical protein
MAEEDTGTVFPLIINSAGAISTPYNNKFRYTFPAGSVQFNNAKVALETINMYYSWFNIMSVLNNNTYQIIHPTLAGSTTVTITMPDGYYSLQSINSYLQQQLISAGLYLVDASGNYVYYVEFIENATYYSIQFNSYPVPTSLPSGYSNPAGMTFPTTLKTPQLVVPANDFTKIIGFSTGTYPSVIQTTNYSVLSDLVPQVSPVQSVILACTLLNNKYSNPQTVLYSFTPAGVGFGGLIQTKPGFPSWIDVQNGSYNTFDISFLDQDFNDLPIRDTNLVVQLLIKQK